MRGSNNSQAASTLRMKPRSLEIIAENHSKLLADKTVETQAETLRELAINYVYSEEGRSFKIEEFMSVKEIKDLLDKIEKEDIAQRHEVIRALQSVSDRELRKHTYWRGNTYKAGSVFSEYLIQKALENNEYGKIPELKVNDHEVYKEDKDSIEGCTKNAVVQLILTEKEFSADDIARRRDKILGEELYNSYYKTWPLNAVQMEKLLQYPPRVQQSFIASSGSGRFAELALSRGSFGEWPEKELQLVPKEELGKILEASSLSDKQKEEFTKHFDEKINYDEIVQRHSDSLIEKHLLEEITRSVRQEDELDINAAAENASQSMCAILRGEESVTYNYAFNRLLDNDKELRENFFNAIEEKITPLTKETAQQAAQQIDNKKARQEFLDNVDKVSSETLQRTRKRISEYDYFVSAPTDKEDLVKHYQEAVTDKIVNDIRYRLLSLNERYYYNRTRRSRFGRR